ncbi:BatA domain-containing protein [Chryseolinea sp. T2]|uniref:BatA domain-containing protein n=1 Tax=Chryseolinea sp. T2 TaxID=3129255 RepID=UPI0030785671
MGLLNPIWLWGLTGLMIPVAIHLLSRKDMRIIHIGSLRHLVHSTTRQAIRIHLNAYGLLALRCLIVAFLALLLAGLLLPGSDNARRWLVVEGGLEQTSQWKNFVDSLEADGFELRRLQPGFPRLNDSEAKTFVPDYWMLAGQLSRVQLDRCIVISRDRASGFAGMRASADSTVTWLTSSPDSSVFVLSLNRSLPDTIIARVGRSDEMRTVYESVKVPVSQENSLMQKYTQVPAAGVSAQPAGGTQQNASASNNTISSLPHTVQELSAIRVAISGTNVALEERRIVEAAIEAISNDVIVPLQFVFVEPNGPLDGDWLIWLSADEPPTNNIASIIRKAPESPEANSIKSFRPLLYASDEAPLLSAHQSKVSNTWWITKPLTLSTAVREQFTLQLATVLLHEANSGLGWAASAYDQRVMSDENRFSMGDQLPDDSKNSHEKTSDTTQREGGGILAVIVALLFACERYIANRQQL